MSAGEDVAYWIVNDGRHQLLYGAGYGVERRTALMFWRRQPIDAAFVAVGFFLASGERGREPSATVPDDFSPGRYRLTTTVTLLDEHRIPVRDARGRPVNSKVSRSFEVTRPSARGQPTYTRRGKQHD